MGVHYHWETWLNGLSCERMLLSTLALNQKLTLRCQGVSDEPTWFKDPLFQRFRRKVQDMDPKAVFSHADQREVWCSRYCTKSIARRNNDMERWRDHRKSMRCQKSPLCKQTTLTAFAATASTRTETATSVSHVAHNLKPFPCPRLTYREEPQIVKYLGRTQRSCGGAPRREVLIKQVMEAFSHRPRHKEPPTEKEIQKAVREAEYAQARWYNNSYGGFVRSAKCLQQGVVQVSGDIFPCGQCKELQRVQIFRNALSKKPPSAKNAKYTPKVMLDEIGGQAFMMHRDVKELMTMVLFNSNKLCCVVTYLIPATET